MAHTMARSTARTKPALKAVPVEQSQAPADTPTNYAMQIAGEMRSTANAMVEQVSAVLILLHPQVASRVTGGTVEQDALDLAIHRLVEGMADIDETFARLQTEPAKEERS